jgi:hypothetical protein
MNGIRQPVSFEKYRDFFKNCTNYKEEEVNGDYKKYLESIETQNNCWEKTRHRNQKWLGAFGCYMCLDCGCDYV